MAIQSDTIVPGDEHVLVADSLEEVRDLQWEKERQLNEIIHQQEKLNEQVRRRKILLYGGIAAVVMGLLSLLYFLRRKSD